MDGSTHPAIARELGRKRMADFVRWTMPGQVEGWHLRTLDRYLDRLVAGDIRRLMVFMPPRHGKSERVSRRLPAYFLGRNPDSEVMQISYAAELAASMNRDVQRIMDSPRYAQLFPAARLPGRGGGRSATRLDGFRPKRTDSLFELAGRKGRLRSAGMLGGLTGMGFSLGIIDDPYKNAEEALSATIRQKVEEEYRSSFLTRQAPDARILLTLTRWHHDDLAGVLTREDPDGWEVLSFPAVSKEARGPADERDGPGQALWPERFPVPWLADMRKAVGSFWWSALYDQEPIPEGGNLFNRHWFGQYRDGGDYWHVAGRDGVHKSDCTVFIAIDPAASEKEAADCTAMAVVSLTPLNDLLVLEVINERLTPDRIPKRIREVCRQWDPAFLVCEDTGFQVAVIQAARQLGDLPPLREVGHHGKGKVVRATPAIIKAEAGQVFVPHHTGPGDAPPWLMPFFDQLERFRGEDEANDMVDAFAYAVRQCPRLVAERSSPDADAVAERLSLRDRDSRAEGRGLWGRR